MKQEPETYEELIRTKRCIDIGEKYVLLQSVCEGAKP